MSASARAARATSAIGCCLRCAFQFGGHVRNTRLTRRGHDTRSAGLRRRERLEPPGGGTPSPAAIEDAVSQRGRCSIALAGGNTPRPIYRLLASRFKEQIPWTDVHVFWGDERFVPAGDPQRNETMVREALLDQVPCPPSNVHAVPAASTAGEAAAQYEAGAAKTFRECLAAI